MEEECYFKIFLKNLSETEIYESRSYLCACVCVHMCAWKLFFMYSEFLTVHSCKTGQIWDAFYSKYNHVNGFLSLHFLSLGLRQQFSALARRIVWIEFISSESSRQEVWNDASTDNTGLQSPWQHQCSVSFGPSSPRSNIIPVESRGTTGERGALRSILPEPLNRGDHCYQFLKHFCREGLCWGGKLFL